MSIGFSYRYIRRPVSVIVAASCALLLSPETGAQGKAALAYITQLQSDAEEALSGPQVSEADPPGMDNATVKNLVGTIVSGRQVCDSIPSGTEAILIRSTIMQLYDRYVYAGLQNPKTTRQQEMSADAWAKFTESAGRNLIRYRGVVLPMYPVLTACNAAFVRTIAASSAVSDPSSSADIRRDVIRQLRYTSALEIFGSVALLKNAELGVTDKKSLADVELEYASVFVGVLSVSDRKQLLDMLQKERLDVDASLAPQVDRLIEMLSSTPCEGLCRD